MFILLINQSYDLLKKLIKYIRFKLKRILKFSQLSRFLKNIFFSF